jgi:hypothetical protein
LIENKRRADENLSKGIDNLIKKLKVS